MLCQNVFKCQMPNILQSISIRGLMFTLEHYMHRAEQHLHSVQLEQVKDHHEVLSTRSRSTLTWAGFQLVMRVLAFKQVENPFEINRQSPKTATHFAPAHLIDPPFHYSIPPFHVPLNLDIHHKL